MLPYLVASICLILFLCAVFALTDFGWRPFICLLIAILLTIALGYAFYSHLYETAYQSAYETTEKFGTWELLPLGKDSPFYVDGRDDYLIYYKMGDNVSNKIKLSYKDVYVYQYDTQANSPIYEQISEDENSLWNESGQFIPTLVQYKTSTRYKLTKPQRFFLLSEDLPYDTSKIRSELHIPEDAILTETLSMNCNCVKNGCNCEPNL